MKQAPTPGPLTTAIDMLSEARDFIDRFSDVRDGDYGTSEPNAAMVMVHEINATIEHLSAPTAPVGASGSELWPVGSWLSSALDDPKVCDAMKSDIRDWFDNGGHLRTQPSGETRDEVARVEAMLPAIERIFPVHVTETPDYAELAFHECAAQAITMEPDTWTALNTLATDLRDLLSALASGGQHSSGEGWIVGNGQDDRWRAWEQGGPVWVDDRAKATRYARREDAEAVHAEDEDAWTVRPYAPVAETAGEAVAGRNVEDLSQALTLALALLGQIEPTDARAVSDEFVSMAAAQCGIQNQEGRDIIAARLKLPFPPIPVEVSFADSAQDDDKLRIAVEALEKIRNRRSIVFGRGEMSGQEAFGIAAEALAALKSTAAQEGGEV